MPKAGRVTLIIFFAIIVVLALSTVVAYFTCLRDLPECDNAEDFNTNTPTEVYASDGTTLLARFQLECREPIDSLEETSIYVVQGTVATEDERFYQHGGVDVIGIFRALLNNITGGTLEGASTIDQQLVRNTILADERDDITIRRKLREAFLAMKLETLYTKDEVLLLYLNTINYGSGAYGIESAAKRYYGVSSKDLTIAQAASLVAIPQSPTYNNPIDYPENNLARRNLVLDRMLSAGNITQEEYEAAVEEPLELNVTDLQYDGLYKYPYFATYVRDCLINDYQLDSAEIFQGGLTVITTLDVDAQEAAEAAAETKRKSMSQNLDVAIVAVDPSTGQIKAMVGGRDYAESQWNLVTQAKRQTGSSFKTFTLLASIKNGIDPWNTTVSCSAGLKFEDDDHVFYNIDGIDYGDRSIQGAFAVSSNTGFVRLCAAVGKGRVIEMARSLGITSDLANDLTVTLGTSSITPLEMANAYATIASRGMYHDATCIIKVTDRYGEVLVDQPKGADGDRVLSVEIASEATKVMETVITNGTGTAARLSNGQPVAGKTGTSENYKDSWFVGFTPFLSVAVWTGDPSNVYSTYGSCSEVFSNFVGAYMTAAEIPVTQFSYASWQPNYTRTFSNPDLDLEGVESIGDEDEEEEEKEAEEAEEGDVPGVEDEGGQGDDGSGGSGGSGGTGGSGESGGTGGSGWGSQTNHGYGDRTS